MIICDHPGDWQTFLRRKDNIGLPIMEVRKKYLLEESAFVDGMNSTLSPTSVASVASAAGAGVGDNFPSVIFVGSKQDGGFPFKKVNDRKKRNAFGVPIYERLAYDIPGSIFEDAETKTRVGVKIVDPFLIRKSAGEKVVSEIKKQVVEPTPTKIKVAEAVVKMEKDRVISEPTPGTKEQIRATLEWNNFQNNWVYIEQGVPFKVVPVGRGRFSTTKHNPFGIVHFFAQGTSYLDIVISPVPFKGLDLGTSPENERIQAPVSKKQVAKKSA